MRVAVAGGGIAGLTSAIALARRGQSVDLYERAPVLKEIGAGIQLSPNAMAVLERLGVMPELVASLFQPEALVIRDAGSGDALARIPLGTTARSRYGAPYCTLLRTDLQAALIATARRERSLSLHLDAEVVDVHANSPEVRFSAAGKERQADVLVAADGARSAIRTSCCAGLPPVPLGRLAWRALLPMPEAGELPARDEIGLWMGTGCHLVHYPVEGGATLNVVVIGEGGDALPIAPFAKIAQRLIERVPEWVQSPLVQVDARQPWVRRRVVLVGDAAHAMAPSAAQGAAQAIEDAYVLAEELGSKTDVEAALSSFTRVRRPRVERVMRNAAQNLHTYEAQGAPARIRNTVLRILPTTLLLSRLDWLFGWKPQ